MKIKNQIKPTMKSLLLTLAVLNAAVATQAQYWTNYYSGPDNQDDFAQAVASDSSGNVFVTGMTISSGSSITTTIKYSAAGLPQWTNHYAGRASPFPSDSPAGLVVDSNGDVVLTGYSLGDTSFDYAAVKYSSLGVPLWTNRYEETAGGADRSGPPAADQAGNVVVAGRSEGIAGEWWSVDIATVKYSSTGVPLWTNRYDGGADISYSLVVDANDDIILVGDGSGFGDDSSYIVKYSSSGAVLWTKRYPTLPGYVQNWPGPVAVDTNGNIFLAGASRRHYFDGVSDLFTNDVTTFKYSPTGNPVWTNVIKGGADNGGPLSLKVDAGGNVIVLQTDSPDWAVLKFSTTGSLVWSNRYSRFSGGGAYWDQSPQGLAVDASGNVYVTGRSVTQDVNANIAHTIKFSSGGIPQWTNFFAIRESGSLNITADASGNLLWAGPSWNGTNYDWAIIKYAAKVTPPTLSLQRLGSNVILSWTNAAFGLQSAPAITGTFTNIPGATSPYTNPIFGGQQFFRLAQ